MSLLTGLMTLSHTHFSNFVEMIKIKAYQSLFYLFKTAGQPYICHHQELIIVLIQRPFGFTGNQVTEPLNLILSAELPTAIQVFRV